MCWFLWARCWVLWLRSGFEKCTSVKTWMMLVSLFLSGWFGYEDCGHPHNSAYGTRWFYDFFSLFNSGLWCFCVIFSSAWFLIDTIASVRPVLFCFLFSSFCVFKAGPGRSAHVWFWWFCLACLSVIFSLFLSLFCLLFSLLWIDWFNLRCLHEVRITLCHARMT